MVGTKKVVANLWREPFRIGLADKPVSLFVSPGTGAILIDEGSGHGRLNSAVMYPDKSPRFSVADAPEAADVNRFLDGFLRPASESKA